MENVNKVMNFIPEMPVRKNVAAYARVSMESDKLINSLRAQISYYNEIIPKNPLWKYVGVYADPFISGTGITNRSELQRLLSDCDNGLIDIVLCKSISRFSRNTLDLLQTIRHLKKLGVEVRFEKENISTLSEEGELLLTILASFAQEESRSISENIKWAIHKGYEKGIVRNSVCYGYRVVNGKFVVMEHEAQVVKSIFKWYLEGDSCYVIRNKLKEAGIKSYYGKNFTSGIISSMLRQEKYVGKALLQKYFVENHITHKIVKNRGELPMYMVENSHEGIISPEMFNAVQQEISKRYGVPIINGIALKDNYQCRPKNCIVKEAPYQRRKCILPHEKRIAMSRYFSKRENYKTLRYDLSMFIKCSTCGQNLTAKKKRFADGTTELWWECFKHTKVSPDTPRPKVMQDDALKKQIASILNIEKFDLSVMEERLSHISVTGDMLTFHFRDNHEITQQYIPNKRLYRRKDK